MFDRDRLDPELRSIAWSLPFHRLMLPPANLYQALSFRLTTVPQGIVHRRFTLRGYEGLPFPVEVFEPEGAAGPLPCLVDIHGGAFCYKAATHHKKLACLYALGARCRVYLPDYHLAPRYPYPAAYEDVLALYRYISEHCEALGIDGARIGLAGDSAGGLLAAALCNRWEAEGLPMPRLQLLVYPATDGTMGPPSMERFTDTPLWNAKNNRRMWTYYCPGLSPRELREASPLYDSLPTVIPDTYIETAQFDCLHNEGVLYGEKLEAAGRQVEYNETMGTFHGYDMALGARVVKESIERRIRFLRQGFSNS